MEHMAEMLKKVPPWGWAVIGLGATVAFALASRHPSPPLNGLPAPANQPPDPAPAPADHGNLDLLSGQLQDIFRFEHALGDRVDHLESAASRHTNVDGGVSYHPNGDAVYTTPVGAALDHALPVATPVASGLSVGWVGDLSRVLETYKNIAHATAPKAPIPDMGATLRTYAPAPSRYTPLTPEQKQLAQIGMMQPVGTSINFTTGTVTQVPVAAPDPQRVYRGGGGGHAR